MDVMLALIAIVSFAGGAYTHALCVRARRDRAERRALAALGRIRRNGDGQLTLAKPGR